MKYNKFELFSCKKRLKFYSTQTKSIKINGVVIGISRKWIRNWEDDLGDVQNMKTQKKKHIESL
jgi:hypothetical protein